MMNDREILDRLEENWAYELVASAQTSLAAQRGRQWKIYDNRAAMESTERLSSGATIREAVINAAERPYKT